MAMAKITTALSGCASLPQSNTISTLDGKYSYVVAGRGKPSVVLESGLGDGMKSWSVLFPQIEGITQVFAYDRAGYGKSQNENRKRDAKTIVSELRALLRAVNILPPYLLVGHSLGGTYMEFFARNYPTEVAGVVLVDSRHSDFTTRCKQGNALLCDPPAMPNILLPPVAKRELDAESLTFHEIRESPDFPKVPLFVLTGMNKPLVGPTFRQVWLETQEDLAKLSPISKHVVCQTCGHYVHHDDPTAVMDAVRWVMKKAVGE
jgi:pimeloyl-ACP methyl ester carboxylesterase